ncbi:hypothetical protein pdam_00006599 [Pocillopora damicornis]|uniref:Uncharacterized protein n=1 Tax=Pocillopora damicornis TaxID=46731 RepID=A0A3M6T8Q4_POCDA|nr:hypothetical protein pdam_00006599 [Pocillopora damicornis]
MASGTRGDCGVANMMLSPKQSVGRDFEENALSPKTVMLKQKKRTKPQLYERRQHEVTNLLSPHVVESGSLSLRGWWMSHVKWEVIDLKRKSRPDVFSVPCQIHRIVETYQYLSLNSSIPIKGIKFQVTSASWKMERPTDGFLGSYKPFYGARVFVVLSSGKRKLLKLDFQPVSGRVASKKVEFIAPKRDRISSVTVMLGCLGYKGYVTFTDLAVKPLYDSKPLKNHSTDLNKLIEPCPAPSKRPSEKKSDLLTETLYSAMSPNDSDAITLVTQLTFNRINILKRNLRLWNGPLSVAIYVLLEDDDDLKNKKREVRMRLPTHIFSKFSTVSVEIIYGNEVGPLYPINRLRNIAIKNVKTRHVFLIDVDFAPSPDLEIMARNQIFDYDKTRNSTDKRVAFVVPAFDGARHVNSKDLPETKEELVNMVKRKKRLAPFKGKIESPLSHSSTNYSRWYHSNESYEVKNYQDKYEPYLIMRYNFVVLPNVWIVHRYHTLSPLSFAHLTDPDSRFVNRLQRFEFISDLYRKHRIGECKNR